MLDECLKTRVTSVENCRKYQAGGGAQAAMEDGATSLDVTAVQGDSATLSRDLSLLIAIDVVRGEAERVLRRSERLAMPEGKSALQVKDELEVVLAGELGDFKVTYTRTDGSP